MTQALTEPFRNNKKSQDDTETLNFRVSPAFKREFKGYAAMQGMSMVELLKEGFELSKTKRKPQ